jgi:hypothetical protein
MRISYIVIYLIFIFFFSSCSSPHFKVLETNSQSGITMEGRYWRGYFSPTGSFEIRIINNSNRDYSNCTIILDGKYKHELEGLHTRERGLIKDSMFTKGEQLTIPFIEDLNNLIFFEGAPEDYIPENIELKCDDCDGVWKLR